MRQTAVSARELHQQLDWRSIDQAYGDGVTFSRWLEEQDPTSRYETGSREAQMDAFERQLDVMGIVTRSNAEQGYYAGTLADFERHGEAGRALMVEYLVRQYRRAAASARSILVSDSNVVGTAMRPYVDAATARMAEMAPAITLSELVAFTTQIDNTAYRALYLNDNLTEYRMVRVGETAEIPAASLTQGERTVDLFKFGRRLDVSYEALRRTPIDTVAFYVARLAVQAEVDKVSQLLKVIVEGDGNANTGATVYDLTDLDPAATAGTLTLKAWLAFKMRFKNPYQLTHELVREDVALSQLLLNTGSANTMLRDLPFGGFEPMNQSFRDNVRFGILDEAPSGKIVALDGNRAIEQINEIGGTINETKRWVEKQVQSLVFTEVGGFAVVDPKATKILDLAA